MKPVLKPSDYRYLGNHNQKHRHDRLSIKPFLNSVVREWFQDDLSEKKILWLTYIRTNAWTDRRVGQNSDLDYA